MALQATITKRKFTFNGVELPDPNPSLTLDQVRDVLAATHPEIATAAIEGPKVSGDSHSYTFVKSVGTKG
jgi:PRTRC genetic system protein C